MLPEHSKLYSKAFISLYFKAVLAKSTKATQIEGMSAKAKGSLKQEVPALKRMYT